MENWMIRELADARVSEEQIILADFSQEPERTEHLENLLTEYLGERPVNGICRWSRREVLRVLKTLLGREFTEEEWVKYLLHSVGEGFGDVREVAKHLSEARWREIVEGLLSGHIKRGHDRQAMEIAGILGRKLSLVELEAIVDGAVTMENGVPDMAIEALPEPQGTKALFRLYRAFCNGSDPHKLKKYVRQLLARKVPALSCWDSSPANEFPDPTGFTG